MREFTRLTLRRPHLVLQAFTSTGRPYNPVVGQCILLVSTQRLSEN